MVQPQTVVVKDVTLQFIGEALRSPKVLLEGATLKLLPGTVYALVARNGAGKSMLLKCINAGKIPAFPPQFSMMYVPQDVLPQGEKTPMELVLSHHDTYFQQLEAAVQTT
jgi:ATPase subunit of ABC transporter with duplicated ATPase domains